MVDLFRKEWTKESSSFLYDIFTDKELELVDAGNVPAPQRLAARFAAKEAFIKGCGAFLNSTFPIKMKEIEIINKSSGMPVINLHGHTRKLLSTAGAGKIFVSLSHENIYASAVVIITDQIISPEEK